MRTFIIAAVVLFTSLITMGQEKIVTTITPQYSEIFGTKISMIMPSDFERSNNFMGFQQEDTNSSIMALDFPTSFEKVSNGLNKENFEKQGVVIKSFESIIINDLPGFFISGTQTAYGAEFTKYILVFGSATETIMINGAAPVEDAVLSERVKTALLSTFYNPTKILSPLDAVDYKVSTQGTAFSFSKSSSNVLIFKREKTGIADTDDDATFVIAKSISKSNFGDKKEFALNRMKGLPMGINKFISTEAVLVGGLDGYEITAEGVNRKTGRKEFAYLMVLYNDLDSYLLYGTSSENQEQNNVVFKKIAKTFTLK